MAVTIAAYRAGLRRERSALSSAFLIALLLEGLCFLGLLNWFSGQPPKPPALEPPMQISLVPAPVPPPPVPAAVIPPPPPVPDVQPPPQEPPPVERPKPPPPPPPPHAHLKPIPKPIVTPPVAHEAPTIPVEPVQEQVQPAPPPVPSASARATLEAQLRRAVEAALIYPASARMLGQHGAARVMFDYLDGQVSDIRLAGTSGYPILDQAALATVREAHYPQPPEDMLHQTLHLSILVEFKIKSE